MELQFFTTESFWDLAIAAAGVSIVLVIVSNPVAFWSWVLKAIHTAEFDLQMAYTEYADYLSSLENPDLDKINDGIEDFRNYHRRYVDENIVATYVQKLYNIHNGAAGKYAR
ncbi:hypothetical protein ACX0G7_09895 [Flavitalea antarctica]